MCFVLFFKYDREQNKEFFVQRRIYFCYCVDYTFLDGVFMFGLPLWFHHQNKQIQKNMTNTCLSFY